MRETFMNHSRDRCCLANSSSRMCRAMTPDPGSSVDDDYVPYLPRKLGEHAIETVREMGYRLPDW